MRLVYVKLNVVFCPTLKDKYHKKGLAIEGVTEVVSYKILVTFGKYSNLLRVSDTYAGSQYLVLSVQ